MFGSLDLVVQESVVLLNCLIKPIKILLATSASRIGCVDVRVTCKKSFRVAADKNTLCPSPCSLIPKLLWPRKYSSCKGFLLFSKRTKS